MWVITKGQQDQQEVIWIEFDVDDHEHFLLPIFTCPDTAASFLPDIKEVQMTHISTVAGLEDIHNLIDMQGIDAVLLDPPDLNDDDEETTKHICATSMPHWRADIFSEALRSMLELSKHYGERRTLQIFDDYLINRKLGWPSRKT